MKYFSYLMVMVLIISLVLLFVLKRPDGKPWLSFEQLSNTSKVTLDSAQARATKLMDQALNMIDEGTPELEQTAPLYRWQDEQGQWHYSDRPLSANSEVYYLDPAKVTVVPAEPLLTPQASVEKEATLDKGGLLNRKDLQKAQQDALKVQALMDERKAKLDKAIEESN